MSTLYILWLRQVKKYFRSKSRIIGSLGQPALFLIVFGFGFGSIYQRAGEGELYPVPCTWYNTHECSFYRFVLRH